MTRSNIMDRQVEAFREAVALWRPEDTREALACRDLEDLLRVGIFLYEQIDAEDRMWRVQLAEGAKYDEVAEDRLDREFEWWLRPCASFEKRIAAFERKGFTVERSEKFRRYHRLARKGRRAQGE